MIVSHNYIYICGVLCLSAVKIVLQALGNVITEYKSQVNQQCVLSIAAFIQGMSDQHELSIARKRFT